jgi:hypothetical protein
VPDCARDAARQCRVRRAGLIWGSNFIPLAVLGNIGVRWAAGSGLHAWETVGWAVLAISTTSILAILAGTLRDVGRWFRRRSTRVHLV